MAAYINLVYGEMFGAWLLHIALVFFVARWLMNSDQAVFTKIIIVIICTMIVSFVLQFGLLLTIQSNSCSGIKDVGAIALGSMIGAKIVGAMMCIPAFIEPMRRVVSQLWKAHEPLQTPQMKKFQDDLTKMATQVGGAGADSEQKIEYQKNPMYEEKSDSDLAPAAAKLLAKEETPHQKYDRQTFNEFTIGAALWAAFGGAYGVGIGSLWAGKCA